MLNFGQNIQYFGQLRTKIWDKNAQKPPYIWQYYLNVAANPEQMYLDCVTFDPIKAEPRKLVFEKKFEINKSQ